MKPNGVLLTEVVKDLFGNGNRSVRKNLSFYVHSASGYVRSVVKPDDPAYRT